jgi:hypothetical protein
MKWIPDRCGIDRYGGCYRQLFRSFVFYQERDALEVIHLGLIGWLRARFGSGHKRKKTVKPEPLGAAEADAAKLQEKIDAIRRKP